MKNLFSRIDLSYVYAFLGEATLGLTFLFYITLARVLGPEQYGVFAAAVALGAILALFIQFGFPVLMSREVAANPLEGPKSTNKFLLLEGLNSLPILLLLLPIAHILGFEGIGITACYLAVFAEIARSAKQTLRAVLQGMGWFRTESISVTLERSFSVLLGCGVLFLSKDLVLVMATVVLVRTLDILGLVYYLSQKLNIWSPLSLNSLIPSLQMAFPFALSGVLWVLYYQVDMVMLKSLASPEETGFYSAAYRILEIFSALPRVIFSVAVTKFSRCYANTPEKLPQEIYKSIRILLAAVLPTLLVAGFLQTQLIGIIYGKAFSPAVESLAIILPSTSLSVFSGLARKILTATRREKSLPPLLIATVILNVVSNFFLIPLLGGVGAALATLLSELVLFVMSMSILSRAGYQQVGKIIFLLGGISLLTTALPSLILKGLNPAVGIGLIVPCIAAIIVLLRRDRFLK